MRQKIKAAWARFKSWVVGAVAAVLAVFGVYIGIPDAETATITITYTAATENEDGTPLALEDIEETRLYCDGSLQITEPGADGAFEWTAVSGQYQCAGTHVANGGLESNFSTEITVVVPVPRPKPPTLIEAP